jgi:hypothetical protein
LLPRAGTALTLVQPASDFDEAKKQQSLHLVCHLRGEPLDLVNLKLVLRPKDGGKEIELPIDTLGDRSFDSLGKFSVQTAIPGQAHGTYHVFLRAIPDGGDGLGFDSEFQP